MTFTVNSTTVSTFLITLMTLLAGSEAAGYFQVLSIGTPNKFIAGLGLAGLVFQAAAFAMSKAKAETPKE